MKLKQSCHEMTDTSCEVKSQSKFKIDGSLQKLGIILVNKEF